MQDGEIVLSVFDGMSCGQIAMIEGKIPIKKYYACEVDKHAIAQTKLNFPNTVHLGDVRDLDVSKLEMVDIFIGGSPCQSFSFAGKRNGMTTKCEIEILTLEQYLELKEQKFQFEGESYLFWEYVRIWRDVQRINPNAKFLLENVEMSKKWERVISETLGVFGVHINSALVSAQNRKRIYWTNIRTKQVGLFGELHSDIPQPYDSGIFLKDVLQPESEIPEKYYINNPKIGFEGLMKDAKARTLRTGGSCSQDEKHNYDLIKCDKKLNPKPDQSKASCFTAGGNSGGNHSDMDVLCVAMRGRNPENSSDRTTGASTEQRLEPKKDGKTNCLTSVQKDNLIIQGSVKLGRTEESKQIRKQNMKKGVDYSPYNAREITGVDIDKSSTLLASPNPQKDNLVLACDYRTDEGLRVRKNGKSGTLAARARNDESCGQLAVQNYKLRRLTPYECCLLQNVPEWYIWTVSDTQCYKMLGNGWTIKVIEHILSFYKPTT